MEKIKIHADAEIGYSLMSRLHDMYMAFVEGVGGDCTSSVVEEKANDYARTKFVELANEFENDLMVWDWVDYGYDEDEDEDEEDDN